HAASAQRAWRRDGRGRRHGRRRPSASPAGRRPGHWPLRCPPARARWPWRGSECASWSPRGDGYGAIAPYPSPGLTSILGAREEAGADGVVAADFHDARNLLAARAIELAAIGAAEIGERESGLERAVGPYRASETSLRDRGLVQRHAAGARRVTRLRDIGDPARNQAGVEIGS